MSLHLPSDNKLSCTLFKLFEPEASMRKTAYALLQVAAILLVLMVSAISSMTGLGLFMMLMRLVGVNIHMHAVTAVATALVAMANPLLAVFGVLTSMVSPLVMGVQRWQSCAVQALDI